MTNSAVKTYREIGTSALVNLTNTLGALPTRNFSTGSFEQASDISGEYMRDLIEARKGKGQTQHACMPGCVIKCSNVFPDENGKEIVRPVEYETIGLMGSNLGIGDLDKIAQFNLICNEYGFDTIETGAAIGVLMAAGVYEFGDVEGVFEVLDGMRKGTPLGRVLGGGALQTGKIYGISKVPHVKGQALPAYDPRGIRGLAITYSKSPMGADHTAGNTVRAPEQHTNKGQLENSRGSIFNSTRVDCLGLCLFVSGALNVEFERLIKLVNARYGTSFSLEDMDNITRQTLNAELNFNKKAGFTIADDRLPEFFYEDVNPANGLVVDFTDEEMSQVWDGII